ncbi:MAG TPA: twin-arginine translocase subunit TatC [Ghiorsea sp.]|nr:twin-arginine translocase subunit TatC [Ghiorsea sp.]HIP07238.1 twin-arginine translocase subunit TatC [Mariprofundaceae bacterium]
MSTATPDPTPLISHLKELKKRLTIAVITYILGVLVLMNFSEVVFEFISTPIRDALPPGTPLIFLNAPDVFFTYLKIALVLSLFATSPITFYQLWAFVAPGLYKNERRAFIGYFLSSLILMISGAAFAFFIVFPLIFEFFLGFSTDLIQAMPAIKEYLTLVLKLLFAFGMSFQIPIIIMLLVRMDLVGIQGLKEKRRYVIVWAFIFAAILTPPDIISQTLLALPMLLLYEVGIITARMALKKKSKPEESSEENV